jgi:hypothetical protein
MPKHCIEPGLPSLCAWQARLSWPFFQVAAGELPRFDLVFLGLGPEAHTARSIRRLVQAAGERFAKATLTAALASLSILGYEHDLDEPAIRLWNDNRHVVEEHVDPT